MTRSGAVFLVGYLGAAFVATLAVGLYTRWSPAYTAYPGAPLRCWRAHFDEQAVLSRRTVSPPAHME